MSLIDVIPLLADGSVSVGEKEKRLSVFIELLDWDDFSQYLMKNIDHAQHFFVLIHDIFLEIGNQLIISPKSMLQEKILSFIVKITQIDPLIHNILATSIQFESLIHRIFDSFDPNEYLSQEAQNFLPLLKFFYAIVSSPELYISQHETCQSLFDFLRIILNFSELAAWACAIYAACFEHHKLAYTVIKMQKDYSEFINKIAKFTKSSDNYLQMSATAVSLYLSPHNLEYAYALRLSMRALQNDSYYLPTAFIATRIIKMAANSNQCFIEPSDLKSLLKCALYHEKFNCYYIIQLLIELTNYHDQLYDIIRESKYITKLFEKIINSNCDFEIIAIRQLLQVISMNDTEFYSHLQSDDIFTITITKLLTSKTSDLMIESLLFIAMTYILSNSLSTNEKIFMNENSNQIFTIFLRLIESNQAVAVLYFCRLLIQCLSNNLNFEARIDRIAVETPLLPLISYILTQSSNKSTIEQALFVFNYFYSKNSHFIDVFSSSLAQNNRTKDKIHHENITDQQNKIQSLQIKQNYLIEENEMLRKKIDEIASINDTTSAENIQIKNSEIKLQDEINILCKENQKLTNDNEYLANKQDLLTSENIELKSSLLANTATIERLMNENEDLKKEVENAKDIHLNPRSLYYYSTQNQVLNQNVSSLESKLQEVTQELNERNRKSSNYLQELKSLEDDYEKLKIENIQLKTKIFTLQNELQDKMNEINGLNLDAEINEVRLQRIEAHENQKTKLLDDALLQNRKFRAGYYLMAREKRKWEHISKFGYRIDTTAKDIGEEAQELSEKTVTQIIEIQ